MPPIPLLTSGALAAERRLIVSLGTIRLFTKHWWFFSLRKSSLITFFCRHIQLDVGYTSNCETQFCVVDYPLCIPMAFVMCVGLSSRMPLFYDCDPIVCQLRNGYSFHYIIMLFSHHAFPNLLFLKLQYMVANKEMIIQAAHVSIINCTVGTFLFLVFYSS